MTTNKLSRFCATLIIRKMRGITAVIALTFNLRTVRATNMGKSNLNIQLAAISTQNTEHKLSG